MQSNKVSPDISDVSMIYDPESRVSTSKVSIKIPSPPVSSPVPTEVTPIRTPIPPPPPPPEDSSVSSNSPLSNNSPISKDSPIRISPDSPVTKDSQVQVSVTPVRVPTRDNEVQVVSNRWSKYVASHNGIPSDHLNTSISSSGNVSSNSSESVGKPGVYAGSPVPILGTKGQQQGMMMVAGASNSQPKEKYIQVENQEDQIR